MRASPITEQFAVRIGDVDLSKPLSADERRQVLDCWMRYKVAVFPGQDLDDETLAEFAAQFGPLFVHVQKQLLRPKGRKDIMELSKGLPRNNVPDSAASAHRQRRCSAVKYGRILPSRASLAARSSTLGLGHVIPRQSLTCQARMHR